MRLLVGSDVLSDTGKWHAFERIAELAPPYIVARPGHEHPDGHAALLPDVSSTRIREALAQRGDADAEAVLASSVPRAALAYITEHGLYQR